MLAGTGCTLAPAGARAEHDAQRVASGCRRVPHGEARVVGAHGAGADDDGVALGPQAVGVRPRLGAGDPLAGAVGGGGAAVEGGRQLQHDEGSAGAAMVRGTARRRLAAAASATPEVDGDPRVPEPGDPPSRHLRVGILERDDHTADAGAR